ncbi:uncharacterized protein [Triticum aestivum]|uniref:uncharacterized protein isoform X1 n=1 Tax=Triticum aestivum TaxID=4565 RepID=UPI001D012012|nr:uncharacterized protein LOC123141706 isoform X1 [Triticum aestivum]
MGQRARRKRARRRPAPPRPAPAASPPPPPGTPYADICRWLGQSGVILVLFETPSGFAVLHYDGVKLFRRNALEDIWSEFIDMPWARMVVFRATALIRMWSLLTPTEARERLVTGSVRWEMVARDIFNRFGWRSCNRIGN